VKKGGAGVKEKCKNLVRVFCSVNKGKQGSGELRHP
jgi:hypothetical protein